MDVHGSRGHSWMWSYLVGVATLAGLPNPAIGQIGACCRGDGVCIATDDPGCTAILGEFLGVGTVCAPGICVGACCTANKECVENNRDFCIAAPGAFQGVGTTCELNCPSFLATVFTFHGQLKDGGVPVSGTVNLECSLWTAAIGGLQVDDTQSLPDVGVVNGLFTVELDFGATSFAGNTRWLQIVVNGTPLSPRQTLTAAPYAIRALSAADAAQLDGQPAAFYQNATNLSSGTLDDLRLSGNVALLNTAQTFTGANTFSAAPSFSAAGSPFAVTGTGLVTNLNADRLDGLHSTAFLQSVPVPLTLSGTNASYIIAGHNANTTGGASGIYGLSFAATGATYGVYGRSNSTSGRGVYGVANSVSGNAYGVYGDVNASNGAGVYGRNTASGGAAFGIIGESTAPFGAGVYGKGNYNGVNAQVFGSSGAGVLGFSSPAAGTTYGVWGFAVDSADYGVYSTGKTGASGTKSFRIDHPDDPENKYLLHYSTESPEVLNAYSGTVTLDPAGGAAVELPHYFAKINKDPRYTLTAVGAPMPMLHVAEEIDEAALSAGATAGAGVAAPICSFRIAGGAPGAKVSWRVEALRNDLWVRNHAVAVEGSRDGVAVQTHAMPVEVEKQGLEKGTYQHPEFYGQPPEKGMNFTAERVRPAAATSLDATPQ